MRLMVTVNTCIVLLYTLYSLDKELTDKYTTNPDLLTDTLIDHWLVHGASTLHHNLAMQALTFPQLMHQLRVKETVPSGKGKRAQVWNARQQALFPPSAARCAFAALRRHRAVAVSSSVTDLCSRV